MCLFARQSPVAVKLSKIYVSRKQTRQNHAETVIYEFLRLMYLRLMKPKLDGDSLFGSDIASKNHFCDELLIV